MADQMKTKDVALVLMMSILTDWILQLQVFMVTVGKVEQRRKIQKECSKSSVILKFILSAKKVLRVFGIAINNDSWITS